jgi:hypothetical protein
MRMYAYIIGKEQYGCQILRCFNLAPGQTTYLLIN